MPELPEVETIRTQLADFLKGHTITAVTVRTPRIFTGDTKKLVGGKIKAVRRFGKVTVIDLSNGYSIVSHIKLTGQFIYRGLHPLQLSPKVVGGVPGKHTHVIFTLDQGGVLYYNDVRKFGWIKVVKTHEVEKVPNIAKLGPEPFGSAQGKPALLTLDKFRAILAKSARPIKVVLMDQEKIGGVGNIYANDAIWLAKINPKRKANSLSTQEQQELYKAVHSVLRAGLKWGGASELSYVTPEGKEGSYQDHSLAYGKEGEKCRRCEKGTFQKFFLSGRGTYICPVCQSKH